MEGEIMEVVSEISQLNPPLLVRVTSNAILDLICACAHVHVCMRALNRECCR